MLKCSKPFLCGKDKYWFTKDFRLHMGNDLPAIEYLNGDKRWYKGGQLHRENDLPAGEYASGNKSWYKNGQLHRDNDLPAIVRVGGSKRWYKNGIAYTPPLWIRIKAIFTKY